MPLAINNLTAWDLDGPTGYEPQRSNNGLIYITLPFQLNGVANNLTNVLQFAVSNIKLPQVSNQQIMVPYLNESRKYAGKPQFDDVQITLTDYIDLNTAAVVSAWRAKVYNPSTGQIGWKRSYAASGNIDMFGPNGQYVRTWNLIGVWPQMFDPGDIDQANDDMVRCTLNLSIDKAIYLLTPLVTGDFTSDG